MEAPMVHHGGPLRDVRLPSLGPHGRRPSAYDGLLSPSVMQHNFMSTSNPPPPLPPPRQIPNGQLESTAHSLYHSRPSEGNNNTAHFQSFEYTGPRASDLRRDIDERRGSASMARSPVEVAPSFGIHSPHYRPRGDDIDSAMWKKLNGGSERRLSTRSSPPLPSLSMPTADNPSRPPADARPYPARLSLPNRSYFDTHLTRSPANMLSPGIHTSLGSSAPGSADYRSPVSVHTPGHDLSPLPSTRHNSIAMTEGSFVMAREQNAEASIDETTRMRHLYIDDRGQQSLHAGQKRRASSPLREEFYQHQGDMVRRRDGVMTHESSTSRINGAFPGSYSTVASSVPSGGYSSNTATAASSMTSLGSVQDYSPRALSPGGISPTNTYAGRHSIPVNHVTSPRSSFSRAPPGPHQRTYSDVMAGGRMVTAPRPMPEVSSALSSSMAAKGLKDPFMCHCCPKKPKKFDSEEELLAHEAEKQYECHYCSSRFKNKNEAERHQNSLHVRRFSWSCSALTSWERAFHDSSIRPGDVDACSYCGEEFQRTGPLGGPQGGRIITENDWEIRIRHLREDHKFRECNSTKKFYRADHFRQHLKHSHAGTSGKWTNMLEHACMVEEANPVLV